jgi:hypothetical protein
MTITYHEEVEQGSDAWVQLRAGVLTASEMRLILTPTLKLADNDKTRAHVYELLAQRITRYVEPQFISDDMLRGMSDEIDARLMYEKMLAPVTSMGFITNDQWGFTIGYSPDGLVGDDGLIEAKSRRQKYQVQTICEHVCVDRCSTIPVDYVLQAQTGLLVSERQWLDFISYSGGLPMAVIRVYPDEKVQAAIVEAATAFEAKLAEKHKQFREALDLRARLFPTERKIEREMFS